VQRILEPGQIEALAQRSIPRIRLPDRADVFSSRASRLRTLSGDGHAIGDYLRLMACVAEAQQAAVASLELTPPTPEQIARARTYGMPVLQATDWPRQPVWRNALSCICESVSTGADVPPPVRDLCDRLRHLPPEEIEPQADALLAGRIEGIDAATAPFLMAALQVYWVGLASRLAVADVGEPGAPGVCPVCGSLPVASIVRSDPRSQGYRFLHCGLCATEWHMVRVTCSQCQSTKGVSYQAIEGGAEAVRAECCDACRTYRKILYQEKDGSVEPVADDLASLALDLLLSDAGYHRGSGNPLLWQPGSLVAVP
jgi:FdhE protein